MSWLRAAAGQQQNCPRSLSTALHGFTSGGEFCKPQLSRRAADQDEICNYSENCIPRTFLAGHGGIYCQRKRLPARISTRLIRMPRVPTPNTEAHAIAPAHLSRLPLTDPPVTPVFPSMVGYVPKAKAEKSLAVMQPPRATPCHSGPHWRRTDGRSLRTFLFPSYVFLYGDDASRVAALESNVVSRILDVPEQRRCCMTCVASIRCYPPNAAGTCKRDGSGQAVEMAGPLVAARDLIQPVANCVWWWKSPFAAVGIRRSRGMDGGTGRPHG